MAHTIVLSSRSFLLHLSSLTLTLIFFLFLAPTCLTLEGTTADDLYPLFHKYGKVVDIFIPRDRRTGDSRGFAFVRYKYADEAQKAVERLDVTKGRSAKHFPSQDTGLEVEVQGDGVIVIGVVEKGRGKETIADEAGALVLGDLVLITPREGEEDAMMMSEEVVVSAVAEVVAVVVLWTVVLLVDEALVQEGVHLLEGASLLVGVHLPGMKVLKEMVMVVEGLQLLGVFHQEGDLPTHEAHPHKIQMISEYGWEENYGHNRTGRNECFEDLLIKNMGVRDFDAGCSSLLTLSV
ncbi:serine/arginine-rich splicing factor SC35 [Cucumis melo var. makuwa]|uniref:Serine/arginine-rich splicing factor SC35 n=1 Tax=Cucumis melo var. makuwa TaxID=1194695 RepID=A0A5A7SMR1_CUCMM|nr:serine/arginine-rich splicing factor SC35 [Cucumis melo var. makuwa]